MFIKIGGNTKLHMKTLEIEEYPFTEKTLKNNFRKLILQNHTDYRGSKKKTQEIIEAYNEIKHLAIATISNTEADKKAKILKEKQNADIFAFFKDCKHCNGTGKKVFIPPELCAECKPTVYELHLFKTLGIEYKKGLKVVICKKCNSFGKFKQKNGLVVTCKNCNGKKFKIIKCRCSFLQKRVTNCIHCKGAGKIEIKPFNPVIPKGAVL